DRFNTLDMSYDGETVLTSTYKGVSFWQSTSGKLKQHILRSSQARTIDAYSSPFDNIFVTSGDDQTKIWRRYDDPALQQVLTGDVEFLPTGMILSPRGDGFDVWASIREGHMGTYRSVPRATLFEPGSRLLANSFDGKLLVTKGEKSERLSIWTTQPPM